jgi:hypothetical protein
MYFATSMSMRAEGMRHSGNVSKKKAPSSATSDEDAIVHIVRPDFGLNTRRPCPVNSLKRQRRPPLLHE